MCLVTEQSLKQAAEQPCQSSPSPQFVMFAPLFGLQQSAISGHQLGKIKEEFSGWLMFRLGLWGNNHNIVRGATKRWCDFWFGISAFMCEGVANQIWHRWQHTGTRLTSGKDTGKCYRGSSFHSKVRQRNIHPMCQFDAQASRINYVIYNCELNHVSFNKQTNWTQKYQLALWLKQHNLVLNFLTDSYYNNTRARCNLWLIRSKCWRKGNVTTNQRSFRSEVLAWGSVRWHSKQLLTLWLRHICVTAAVLTFKPVFAHAIKSAFLLLTLTENVLIKTQNFSKLSTSCTKMCCRYKTVTQDWLGKIDTYWTG